jgi:ketosteroid isomerase-like protein
MSAEHEIRGMIEPWTAAVRARDIEGVVADHADDRLMFDVPPPNRLDGLAVYRESWAPFFQWSQGRAHFDLVDLDVKAGDDLGFATALIRCRRREEPVRDPEPLLRLTVGLEKRGDRWLIVHEHHSFPDHAVAA